MKFNRKMFKVAAKKSVGGSYVRARKVEAFGLTFASVLEYEFYCYVKSLDIKFEYQPKYKIYNRIEKSKKHFLIEDGPISGVTVTADFLLHLEGMRLLVDVKGFLEKVDETGKVIQNRETKYLRFKYNLLRRFFFETGEFDIKVALVQKTDIAEFRNRIENYMKGLTKTINTDFRKPKKRGSKR